MTNTTDGGMELSEKATTPTTGFSKRFSLIRNGLSKKNNPSHHPRRAAAAAAAEAAPPPLVVFEVPLARPASSSRRKDATNGTNSSTGSRSGSRSGLERRRESSGGKLSRRPRVNSKTRKSSSKGGGAGGAGGGGDQVNPGPSVRPRSFSSRRLRPKLKVRTDRTNTARTKRSPRAGGRLPQQQQKQKESTTPVATTATVADDAHSLPAAQSVVPPVQAVPTVPPSHTSQATWAAEKSGESASKTTTTGKTPKTAEAQRPTGPVATTPATVASERRDDQPASSSSTSSSLTAGARDGTKQDTSQRRPSKASLSLSRLSGRFRGTSGGGTKKKDGNTAASPGPVPVKTTPIKTTFIPVSSSKAVALPASMGTTTAPAGAVPRAMPSVAPDGGGSDVAAGSKTDLAASPSPPKRLPERPPPPPPMGAASGSGGGGSITGHTPKGLEERIELVVVSDNAGTPFIRILMSKNFVTSTSRQSNPSSPYQNNTSLADKIAHRSSMLSTKAFQRFGSRFMPKRDNFLTSQSGEDTSISKSFRFGNGSRNFNHHGTRKDNSSSPACVADQREEEAEMVLQGAADKSTKSSNKNASFRRPLSSLRALPSKYGVRMGTSRSEEAETTSRSKPATELQTHSPAIEPSLQSPRTNKEIARPPNPPNSTESKNAESKRGARTLLVLPSETKDDAEDEGREDESAKGGESTWTTESYNRDAYPDEDLDFLDSLCSPWERESSRVRPLETGDDDIREDNFDMTRIGSSMSMSAGDTDQSEIYTKTQSNKSLAGVIHAPNAREMYVSDEQIIEQSSTWASTFNWIGASSMEEESSQVGDERDLRIVESDGSGSTTSSWFSMVKEDQSEGSICTSDYDELEEDFFDLHDHDYGSSSEENDDEEEEEDNFEDDSSMDDGTTDDYDERVISASIDTQHRTQEGNLSGGNSKDLSDISSTLLQTSKHAQSHKQARTGHSSSTNGIERPRFDGLSDNINPVKQPRKELERSLGSVERAVSKFRTHAHRLGMNELDLLYAIDDVD